MMAQYMWDKCCILIIMIVCIITTMIFIISFQHRTVQNGEGTSWPGLTRCPIWMSAPFKSFSENNIGGFSKTSQELQMLSSVILSGNKYCHQFRFSIVRIVISVSNVTSLCNCQIIKKLSSYQKLSEM